MASAASRLRRLPDPSPDAPQRYSLERALEMVRARARPTPPPPVPVAPSSPKAPWSIAAFDALGLARELAAHARRDADHDYIRQLTELFSRPDVVAELWGREAHAQAIRWKLRMRDATERRDAATTPTERRHADREIAFCSEQEAKGEARALFLRSEAAKFVEARTKKAEAELAAAEKAKEREAKQSVRARRDRLDPMTEELLREAETAAADHLRLHGEDAT